MQFVHLRLHTEYSADSIIRLPGLMSRIKDADMVAVALTDETNLFAAIKFYRAARSKGVKPIFGCDIWVDRGNGAKPSRQTLLCLNNAGYHQVCVLISRAYREGTRLGAVPMIAWSWLTPEILADCIVLSGGLSGDVAQAILSENQAQAEKYADEWIALTAPDRYFIEISRLNMPHEDEAIQKTVELACDRGLGVVATQQPCFLEAADHQAHTVRVCINEGYVLTDKRRVVNHSDQQYVTTPAEMSVLFEDIPEALTNAVEIAKRCNVTLDLGRVELPEFPVPASMTTNEYLIQVSETGLKERFQQYEARQTYPEGFDESAYWARLKTECDVITKMGFPGYFLIVADFIQWAKKSGIPVGPGRGSGAGSLVAFALGITDIDPLPYELLFERFLNPERISMPDFDVDFCMVGRDRVIDYIASRYGRDSVSQIITFGSMAAKAVVRDVGRVMEQPYGFVDSIAKLIPLDIGMTLSKALAEEEALSLRYEKEEEVKAIIDMALKLEGLTRNVGKHAGGVVIAPGLLTDFTPIYCESQGALQLVSQYDKDDVEAVGLVKFDLLGLRNLTIIDQALETVNAIRAQQHETPLDITQIPLDDQDTFALLGRCETTAIFQLESRGMKDLIKRLQPDCFEEIIALVALFRPGPLQSGMVDDFIMRKHGRSPIAYPHPLTEEVLKPTYGIILYQEQVMKLAQVLAGYTLGAADMLRRAMGKKKPEEMAKQREIFMKGALANGIEEETATGIFDLMEKFAGYGFNKSHSAAYALVSYQTAYLKAHYPAAFMAAVLSSDMDNTDKVVLFVDDARTLGIGLHPPHVNQGFFKFTVRDNEIVYGLGALKGVGESVVEAIVAEREAEGPYQHLLDFATRLAGAKINRRVFEALIDAGAFDTAGFDGVQSYSRDDLLASIEGVLASVDQVSRNENSGQGDLFGVCESEQVWRPKLAHYQSHPVERLAREKAILGHYLSGHPVTPLRAELRALGTVPIKQLAPTAKGKTVKVAGIITATRRLRTKRGSLMQVVNLDDGQSACEAVAFSDAMVEYQGVLKVDQIVILSCEVRLDDYSGGMRLSIRSAETLSQAREAACSRIVLRLSAAQMQDGALEMLKEFLGECPAGESQVSVIYAGDGFEATLNLADNHAIRLDAETYDELHRRFQQCDLVVGA